MQPGWRTIGSDPKAVVLKFERASEPPGELIKIEIAVPHPPDFPIQKV